MHNGYREEDGSCDQEAPTLITQASEDVGEPSTDENDKDEEGGKTVAALLAEVVFHVVEV